MKSRSLVFNLIASGLIFLVIPAFAHADQQSDQELRDEIAALRKGQEKMRADLAEIKQLLQRSPVPASPPRSPSVAGKTFDLGDNPVRGSDDAKVVLLEFTDYQCPFCLRHTTQTHPQIEREYIGAGKIRYASLDMPIASLHPLAFKASEASHCAEEQGQFWQMRDRLFANQRTLEPWNAHAESLGLDVAQYEACLSSGKYADAVRSDMAEAQKAGVSGTPSFVVGLVDNEDPTKVHGLTFIRGAQAFAAFKAALDDASTAAAKTKSN
jgi:protein-disulfide isomerase